MQQEIEAKFLNIDPEQIRAKLKEAGAILEQPMRLMRRVQFDYPDMRYKNDNYTERLRVRDEGNKVTTTYKKKNDTNYTYELETTVGSFDDMVNIYKAIGLKDFSYQESKRETWNLDGVEVVIDEWPWLNTYIEIEGLDEPSIKVAAEKLALEWRNAKFGSVDTAYMDQYKGMKETDSIGEVPEARFDTPLPQYLKDKLVK